MGNLLPIPMVIPGTLLSTRHGPERYLVRNNGGRLQAVGSASRGVALSMEKETVFLLLPMLLSLSCSPESEFGEPNFRGQLIREDASPASKCNRMMSETWRRRAGNFRIMLRVASVRRKTLAPLRDATADVKSYLTCFPLDTRLRGEQTS